MTAPFQYLLITVKVIRLEKISFSDTQNPKLFVNTLTVDEKHFPVTRDNLTHSIQIQLSRKEKTFFSIFSSIFKIYIKFPKKR